MTWYQPNTAYSLWGNAANTSSNDERSSETYQIGGRTRYNMTDNDYLFGQASWLSDRFNGYDSRDVLAAGYGRQVLNGPVHSLRVEFGPGVRYDDFHDGGHETRGLGYGALSYQWQMTDTTKFIQGVSVLSSFNDNTTVNSETGLQVAINAHFALKLAYNVTGTTIRRNRHQNTPTPKRRFCSPTRCNVPYCNKTGRLSRPVFVLLSCAASAHARAKYPKGPAVIGQRYRQDHGVAA